MPFSTEFCENRLSSFCLILLSSKHSENITSLADVINDRKENQIVTDNKKQAKAKA